MCGDIYMKTEWINTIASLVYLYGIVHTKNLCEVLPHYTKEKITRNALTPYLIETSKQHPDLIKDGDFLYRKDLEKEYAFKLYRESKKKPYYFPGNSELQNYQNLQSVPLNDTHLSFMRLLKQMQPEIHAEALMKEVIAMIQKDASIQSIMYMFLDKGVIIKDPKQVKVFSDALVLVFNHTRIYKNHGYTPAELAEIYKK